MGMLHLELLRERLAEDFRVLTLPLEEPYVAFRATLRGGAAATGEHAPAGKTRIRKGTAHVHNPDPDAVAKVELNPAARGAGVVFKEGKDLEASPELRAALESGAREGLRTAGPRGIPITDVSVTLLSVQAKDPAGVAAAAASAVQLAAQEAKGATLLEPVMEVEIQVPDRSASTVVSDLEKRHGEQIFTRESEAQTTTIEAEVPLRRMLGYWKDIHKMTSGEGSFTLRLKRYREVDASSERQILDNELAAA
jgi:elongation factor G